MKKSILFSCQNYDMATSCLHYFSKKLMKEIEFVGEFNIVNLEGRKATKENFEKAVAKTNPRLIILNGHGFKNAVCGHNGKTILYEGNINLLESKITYAVACDSSEKLGDIAVTKGKADAYIGYEAHFMVITDPSRSSTLSKDKNLKVFIKPYTTSVLSLISGLNVEESIANTKKVLKDLIREYGVYGIRDRYGDAPLIRFALYWDLTFLKGYGNLSSVV